MACACGGKLSWRARAHAVFTARGRALPPELAEALTEWDSADRYAASELALHEAGHAVVCEELGGKLDGAIVRADGSGDAFGTWPKDEAGRVVTMLAGAAAVAKSRGGELYVSEQDLLRHTSAAWRSPDIRCDLCKVCATIIKNRKAATDYSVICVVRGYELRVNALLAQSDIWHRVELFARELGRRRGQFVPVEDLRRLEKAARTRRVEFPPSLRKADVTPSSYRRTDNSIEVVWTTGATVRRMGLDGPYDEELLVEPSAVRLDRLNSGAPFLNTHSDWKLEDVLGSVIPGSAKITNGIGTCRIQLSNAKADADIVAKIKDGIIRNISVGYAIYRVEIVEPKSGGVPTWRVVDWEPYEISAVPVPADPGSTIRKRQQLGLSECAIIDRSARSARAAQRKRMQSNIARALHEYPGGLS